LEETTNRTTVKKREKGAAWERRNNEGVTQEEEGSKGRGLPERDQDKGDKEQICTRIRKTKTYFMKLRGKRRAHEDGGYYEVLNYSRK